MTPEEKDRLLARSIALRGDLESLIERIDMEGANRRVNPFWARWLSRTLMNDRGLLNIAIDRVIFSASVRGMESHNMWGRLATAYDAASFAMSYGHQLLMEETGE